MRKMVRRLFLIPLVLLLASLPLAAAGPQVQHGAGGAVAAPDETAARIGIDILKQGGNAADAAVAVSFALAVTWPEAGNVGGGGFWISRDAKGKVLVIDYREVAPRGARRDLFVHPREGGKPPSSTEGPFASGVPGTVAGLALAHRRLGHLPWKRVVDPAVRLARGGFVVTEELTSSVAKEKDRLARERETATLLLPGGEPLAAGTVLKQPELARTLEAIRDHGADGFYRGRVARQIEEGQARDGGLITRGDLGRYQAKIRNPTLFRFAGAEVITTPAPSSGPALAEMGMLVQLVGMEKIRPRDASSAHWMAEIEKRSFRDRNRYLGDPAFPNVRQKLLTDPSRLKVIAASIDPNRSTPSEALRLPDREKPATTHFSVMDSTGAAVAITTTLNDSFGNARLAPGLGFLWNNEMDDFATRPGQKNLYGLIQGEANAVAPGKRMLSSMCPSIAVVGGRNALVFGSPGGSTIPTTNFQVLVNVFLRGEPLEAAVAAPRFHQQDFPDKIEYEGSRFDAAWITALEKLGHRVEERATDREPHAKLGRVHAIALRSDGTMTAVADPRSGGVGLVVRPSP